jgi:predicted nucleotidyltransferase
LNIYPYGSKIYGTNNEDSDDDFVIVYRSSLLPSGAFKDNAISSQDRSVQGSCYSRSGFIDAINNYQISALECIFLPDDKIIQKKMNFVMNKFDVRELSKKIISTASSSWHFANLAYQDDHIDSSKKNIYHSLRILDFGIQIKENRKIVDYGSASLYKELVDHAENYKPKNFHDLFIELSEKLKS